MTEVHRTAENMALDESAYALTTETGRYERGVLFILPRL